MRLGTAEGASDSKGKSSSRRLYCYCFVAIAGSYVTSLLEWFLLCLHSLILKWRKKNVTNQELLLARVPLFRNLSGAALSALTLRYNQRRFPARSVLMRQGEASDCMHIILSGRVVIEREHPDLRHPVLLANLGAGEVVGEMGLLDGEPRSATVTAIEETETLALAAAAVGQAMVEVPELSAALLRILSQRLRTTDALVDEALRRGWLEVPLL